MNEVRKEIIKIIEPYMGKDLVDGCLIENEGKIEKIAFYCKKEKDYISVNDLGSVRYDFKEIDKILGHYDITAVEKYIESKIESVTEIELDWDCKIFKENGYEKCRIPHKPLHLYTEQEEKDLLELLNGLK